MMRRIVLLVILALVVAVSGCVQNEQSKESGKTATTDFSYQGEIIKKELPNEGVTCFIYAERTGNDGLRPTAGGISCLPMEKTAGESSE